MIQLTIPANAPSLNAVLRMHWAHRRKLGHDWYHRILIALGEERYGVKRIERAKVSIERSGRLLDRDNLYGSAKVIVDQLKALKLILDDDPAHCELEVTQVRGRAQTVIRLEAV